MKLTLEQLELQELFKEFISKLAADAARYTGGPVRIKCDLHLGVGEEKYKDKAMEYGSIMKEIIQTIEIEQQASQQGPAGIMVQ